MDTTLEKLKKVDWKGVCAILATLGIVASANPLSVLISVLGVFLVTAINAWTQMSNIKLGRAWLTVILYVVSLILAVILEPMGIPALPAWHGDAGLFGADLAAFLQGSMPLVSMATASATLIYNSLKTIVFDKLLLIPG